MLDRLEARTLFSITTYPAAMTGFGSALTTDGAGNVYVTNASDNSIEKFSKNSDGTITAPARLDAGTLFPTDIVYDATTSKLYFTSGAEVGAMNADGSGLDFVSVSDPAQGHVESVLALAVTADGSVWFGTGQDTTDSATLTGTSLLGRFVGGDIHAVQQTEIPSSHQFISAIAAGAGNSVWVVDQGVADTSPQAFDSSISHVTVSTGGAFSFTTTAIPTSKALVGGIAAASDGSVWIAVDNDPSSPTARPAVADQLQHVTFDSSGNATFTGVIIPKDSGEEAATTPSALTIDSSGTLWFTETDYSASAGRLSSYTPSSGVFDREVIPDAMMGNALRISIVNGVSTKDVWLVTQDGVVADKTVAVAASGFNISGRTLSGTEDVALAATVAGVNTAVVGTFTGPAGTYAVSIAWSDGSTSAGRIVTGTDGTKYIALAAGVTKTFASQGVYSGVISVSDGVTSKTATATVNVGNALSASQGVRVTPLFGRFVLTVVATFTSAVNAPASAFTASINWGDGTSTGIVIRNPLNPSQYFVIGSHNYHASGNYTIATTIRNPSLNEVTTATAVIHV